MQRRFRLALAVCSLCRFSVSGKCTMKNRSVLKESKRNIVDCSYLREIMELVDAER